MARTELRYLDEARTKQELVILCSEDELQQLNAKSNELTGKHYRDGVKREICDTEWRQFQLHLFGWSLMQRVAEIEREGLQIRIALDHPPA